MPSERPKNGCRLCKREVMIIFEHKDVSIFRLKLIQYFEHLYTVMIHLGQRTRELLLPHCKHTLHAPALVDTYIDKNPDEPGLE